MNFEDWLKNKAKFTFFTLTLCLVGLLLCKAYKAIVGEKSAHRTREKTV